MEIVVMFYEEVASNSETQQAHIEGREFSDAAHSSD